MLTALLAWTVIFGLYLIPTIIAAVRRKPDLGMIFFMNMFAGWTVLGWVLALGMAVWKINREQYSGGH